MAPGYAKASDKRPQVLHTFLVYRLHFDRFSSRFDEILHGFHEKFMAFSGSMAGRGPLAMRSGLRRRAADLLRPRQPGALQDILSGANEMQWKSILKELEVHSLL